jgi:DNA-binding NtrC family response regulator
MSEDKINVLIVDDEEMFLEMTKTRLEARGLNVTAVDRGEKAIEEAKNKSFDVALVDLKMPGINGEETLKALKKEDKWLEVVILTGHGTIDSAIECTKSGAYHYLQKPCKLEELLEVLKDAYQKRIMGKKNLDEERMKKIAGLALVESPLEILRRLKEIDKG